MKTVVLKFGGTSVGSIDRIKKVCKIIASYKKKKNNFLHRCYPKYVSIIIMTNLLKGSKIIKKPRI